MYRRTPESGPAGTTLKADKVRGADKPSMRLIHLALAGLVLLTTACATTASSSSGGVQTVQPRVIEPGAQTLEAGTKPRVLLRQNLRKEAYAVSGDNASELRADLDRKRPPSPDGRRFDAN